MDILQSLVISSHSLFAPGAQLVGASRFAEPFAEPSYQVPRISYNTLLDCDVLICCAFLILMVLGNCFVHHDAKTAVGFTGGFSA